MSRAQPEQKPDDRDKIPWSRLFRDEVLSDEVATLVTVFAAAVNGAAMGDRALAAAADSESADGEALLEALLQLPLFAGFPRGINALASFRKYFGDEIGPNAKTKAASKPATELDRDPKALRKRGEALFRRVYADHAERVLADLDRFHPDLGPWILTSAYGGILSRPQLDPATRELCAVAALIVSGDVRQLSSHLRGALHCGASPAKTRAAAERARPFVSPGAWQKAQVIITRTLNATPGSTPDGRPHAL
ncbi:MAG: carboxymuconolactone decarboxylase family protein [Planctomycetota bacterium]